jgi:hypothetical protein
MLYLTMDNQHGVQSQRTTTLSAKCLLALRPLFLQHLSDDHLSLCFPFSTVLAGIVQVLITAHAEHSALFQLLCQWNLHHRESVG